MQAPISAIFKMLDLASTYFSIFRLATECRKHMQEATLSDSYLNIRLMNILTSVDPGSVSHVEVSEWPHLHSNVSSKNWQPY